MLKETFGGIKEKQTQGTLDHVEINRTTVAYMLYVFVKIRGTKFTTNFFAQNLYMKKLVIIGCINQQHMYPIHKKSSWTISKINIQEPT